MQKRDRNIERNKEKTQEENLERKELYLFQRKTDCYSGSDPSINVRLNLFTSREVNLVLEHPRSTNYIVWTPNVRTQYHFGVVTNQVLTVGKKIILVLSPNLITLYFTT